MNIPQVQVSVRWRNFSPLQGNTINPVNIIIDTKSEEIIENPITGHRTLTGRSIPVSPTVVLDFSLVCTHHHHIQRFLLEKLIRHRWLCADLASHISMVATHLGFGHNSFVIDIFVKVTYQTLAISSDHPLSNREELRLQAVILRMVLLGRVDKEEVKSLEIEKESCSICLDDLSDSSKHGVLTRMNCSHVFHDRCLLEWLKRKNTCPLCRVVLYDR